MMIVVMRSLRKMCLVLNRKEGLYSLEDFNARVGKSVDMGCNR